MRKSICILILILITFLFRGDIVAADAIYRLMHNDQNVLIIGEITAMDAEKIEIKAEDYIVSAKDISKSKHKEQLEPQAVFVNRAKEYWFNGKAVGDYVIVSLNANGDTYDVAWGVYLVDALDYQTLKVTAHSPVDSAMLTDFVNSGGLYTKYSVNIDKVTRYYDGTETIIYDGQDHTDNIKATPESSQMEVSEIEVYAEPTSEAASVQAIHENESSGELINKTMLIVCGIVFMTLLF